MGKLIAGRDGLIGRIVGLLGHDAFQIVDLHIVIIFALFGIFQLKGFFCLVDCSLSL